MRRTIPMRRTLLGLLAALSLAAGEPDPAAQAKTVWSTAAKAGDFWTCLQLESWGRARTPAVRLGPALGASTTIGDPLFALPDRISDIVDLGDRLVTWTRERVFLLAPDGRPLQPSLVCSVEGGDKQVGFGGNVIGSVRQDERNMRRFLTLAAQRLADGKVVISAEHNLGQMHAWDGGAVVADDGSAIATHLGVDDPARPPNAERPRMIVVASDRLPQPVIVGGLHRPLGIGRSGAWLIAHNARGHMMLVRPEGQGQRRQRILGAAIGPGLAACMVEKVPTLVKIDGSDVPLQGGPAIGNDHTLMTVGGWLVLSSGYGAKAVSEGDLLGEGAGQVTDQPCTLALWRWADLAADPAAKPAMTVVGQPSRADDQAAGLWLWEGNAVDLLDLSGREPARSRVLDAPAAVGWVNSNLHCLVVHLPDDRKLVYSPERKVLWDGAASSLSVKRRDLMLVEVRKGERSEFSLVWLAEDPEKRRSVRLPLRPGEYIAAVSHRAPDRVMINHDGEGSWRVVDFEAKGQMSSSIPPAPPVERPDVAELSWYMPWGRFYREGARLVAKAAGPSADLMARINLRDAWRVGGTTLLLDDDGRVWSSGRKKGEWIEIGQALRADRFAMSGKLLLLARGDRPMAVFAPGPKLDPADRAAQVEPLPPGPWRIDRRTRFVQPRGKQYDWDFARVAWGDIALRSPEQSGLFIVTDPLVLELVPEMARFFGSL